MPKIASALLLLTLALSSFEAAGQSRYRVEKINKVDFILPPKSKLKTKGDGGNVVAKYRYHFVTLKNLRNSYLGAAEQVEVADYYYNERPGGKVDEVSAGDPFESFKVPGSEFCAVLYSGENVTLRIDYEAVLANHKSPYAAPRDGNEIIEMFSKLGVNLLEHFSQKEKDTAHPWPTGISQNVVEKVYELMPVPQPASLARYGMVVTDYESFVLINPKILLLVDNVEKSYLEPERNSDWQFNLLGQTLIPMNRGEDGSLVQSPFLKLANRLSETKLKDGSTLQASSADVQMSAQLAQSRFIAIYQEGFKRNNSKADIGADDCQEAELNHTVCNAELLLFKNADKEFFDCMNLFKPANRCRNNKHIISSAFGPRSLITPVIYVLLNGEPQLVKLNSTLRFLSQRHDLPPLKRLKVYRKHRGGYRRVDGFGGDLLLLPNDKVSFKQ